MELMPESDEFSQELLHPNWNIVETHFGVAIPQCLKDYYSDPSKILLTDFELETPIEVEGRKRIRVDCFDKITDHSTLHFPGFERFLDIADDGGEGAYFIDPKEDDPEVHLFILDSYDLYSTGLLLSEFLSNPRLEREPED